MRRAPRLDATDASATAPRSLKRVRRSGDHRRVDLSIRSLASSPQIAPVGDPSRIDTGGAESGPRETRDRGSEDDVRISADARRLLAAEEDERNGAGLDRDLTRDEQEQVRELAARDREVRQHEQAHLAAAGDLASGGPSYTYQTGPDGKRYAVGGEVQIQLREGRDPEETLSNARRAKRAALAPAEPSPQDRRVAAKADALALSAQQEIAEARATGEPETEAAGGVSAAAGSAPVLDGAGPSAAPLAGAGGESQPRRGIDLLA